VATDQVSRATDLDSRVEIDRAFLAIALEHRATGPASAIGRASAATDRDDQEGTSISATM
jgi:hypothetical protein